MKWNVFATALLPFVVLACDDDPVAPTTGSVEVTITTGGDGTDADGFVVTLDQDVASEDVEVDDTAVFDDVEPGSHELELTDLADNCTVDGDNPLTVTVEAGSTAEASFGVTCTAA